jgi:hypothetical protein
VFAMNHDSVISEEHRLGIPSERCPATATLLALVEVSYVWF